MSDSEIMTILVLFHTHRFRDLKSFYLGYICQHMRGDFPHRISHNRFVERQAQVALHLLPFLQICALGKCSGISIIDSTLLASCHIKRERQHRTMRGWAAKGSAPWAGSTASSYILSSITGERLSSGSSRQAM